MRPYRCVPQSQDRQLCGHPLAFAALSLNVGAVASDFSQPHHFMSRQLYVHKQLYAAIFFCAHVFLASAVAVKVKVERCWVALFEAQTHIEKGLLLALGPDVVLRAVTRPNDITIYPSYRSFRHPLVPESLEPQYVLILDMPGLVIVEAHMSVPRTLVFPHCYRVGWLTSLI